MQQVGALRRKGGRSEARKQQKPEEERDRETESDRERERETERERERDRERYRDMEQGREVGSVSILQLCHNWLRAPEPDHNLQQWCKFPHLH